MEGTRDKDVFLRTAPVVKSVGTNKNKLRKTAASILFLTFIVPSAFCSVGTLAGYYQIDNDSSKALAVTDSTTKRTRAAFFGLTYGNNSSFLGRYQAEILPYYALDVSYKSKTGLWLSLLAYDIRNSTSSVDEIDVMAGWSFDLSKRVDASVFYTRYFFTESTDLIKASVANTATGSAGLDWGFLYTKISGHYIFGDGEDFFLVVDNSRYFEITKLFRKDDYLSLDPKISIISGTQTFVDTHYINRGTPLVDHPGGGASPPRGKPGSGSGTGSTVQSLQTTFDILSYELSLPIAYNVGQFSFEINGRYSIPVNLLEGDSSVPQFFFTGGVVFYVSSK